MTEIIGGPALADPVVSDPWIGCADPPILFGTGTLYIRDPATGIEVDAGNFNLVDFIGDGEEFMFFDGTTGSLAAGAISTAYRLELTGDSFSFEQLSRMINEPVIPYVGGLQLNLETVRDLTMRRIRFVKDLFIDGACATSQSCPFLEIELWHCFFAVPFRYSFGRGVSTDHLFHLISLPDFLNHPASPFGRVAQVCPAEAGS